MSVVKKEKTIIKERIKFIKDLESTFQLAIEAGDYKAAIQAKQVIGKAKGFMEKGNKSISLMELSQDELDSLIKEAENFYNDERKEKA